jgi:hypothetical protein
MFRARSRSHDGKETAVGERGTNPSLPRPDEEGTEGGPADEPPEKAPEPEEEHDLIENEGGEKGKPRQGQ